MDRRTAAAVIGIGLVALSFGTIAGGEPEGDGPTIHWLRSASEAAKAASASGRPILVYVRSASCGYCDLLQRNVWEDPRVIRRIQDGFVPLKLTQEENREQLAVLDVKAFPSVLVFSSSLEYMFRIDGYVDAAEFLKRIERSDARIAALPDSGDTRRR